MNVAHRAFGPFLGRDRPLQPLPGRSAIWRKKTWNKRKDWLKSDKLGELKESGVDRGVGLVSRMCRCLACLLIIT